MSQIKFKILFQSFWHEVSCIDLFFFFASLWRLGTSNLPHFDWTTQGVLFLSVRSLRNRLSFCSAVFENQYLMSFEMIKKFIVPCSKMVIPLEMCLYSLQNECCPRSPHGLRFKLRFEQFDKQNRIHVLVFWIVKMTFRKANFIYMLSFVLLRLSTFFEAIQFVFMRFYF